MQWKVHHTWNDRMSKKAHPEHYHDVIYLGFWSLMCEKDEKEREREGQALINTVTVLTVRFQQDHFFLS